MKDCHTTKAKHEQKVTYFTDNYCAYAHRSSVHMDHFETYIFISSHQWYQVHLTQYNVFSSGTTCDFPSAVKFASAEG